MKNFLTRNECRKCKEPRGADGFGGGDNAGSMKGRGSGARGQDWTCADCGLSNFSTRNECRKCNKPRPEGEGSSFEGGRSMPPSKEWLCESCKFQNRMTRKECMKCQAPKPDHPQLVESEFRKPRPKNTYGGDQFGRDSRSRDVRPDDDRPRKSYSTSWGTSDSQWGGDARPSYRGSTRGSNSSWSQQKDPWQSSSQADQTTQQDAGGWGEPSDPPKQ